MRRRILLLRLRLPKLPEMTDLDYANLCARIYAVDAATDPFWAHYWNLNGIVCGHVVIEGVDYFIFRGSDNADDWIRDLDAIPVWSPDIGFVHAGFYKGIAELHPVLLAVTGAKACFGGHSLGAAHACLMTGLFIRRSQLIGVPCPVQELVTFGQPKPAYANLARLIVKSGIRHVSYRNRNDPVPLVPLTIPPFIDYVHTEDWISMDAAPSPTDLEPLRDHHIQLYIQGLQPAALVEATVKAAVESLV